MPREGAKQAEEESKMGDEERKGEGQEDDAAVAAVHAAEQVWELQDTMVALLMWTRAKVALCCRAPGGAPTATRGRYAVRQQVFFH
jgi:hypothetical protein